MAVAGATAIADSDLCVAIDLEQRWNLMKLMPTQIMSWWQIISPGLAGSVPEAFRDGFIESNLQRSAISGNLDIWFIMLDGETKPRGLVATTITHDTNAGLRNFLIYALYAYGKIDKEFWYYGLKTLEEYARSKGCGRVIAYSENPKVGKILEAVGAEESKMYTWELLEVVDGLADEPDEELD